MVGDRLRVRPVEKQTGDTVTGATINGTGGLVIQAERVGNDTLLAQIQTTSSSGPRVGRAAAAIERGLQPGAP